MQWLFSLKSMRHTFCVLFRPRTSCIMWTERYFESLVKDALIFMFIKALSIIIMVKFKSSLQKLFNNQIVPEQKTNTIMVYLINMQHVLLIFWKNQACMVLLHPACFINFGKNSSLHGLLHPISSENHHSSHYFASKLTLMVKNWMECSLKTYSFNHMMS